jgi:ABC-2 type transport system ATP-binding protein
MRPIIEASQLVKRYGRVAALEGLDLVVDSGGVVALLGPNGAGKTTFVSLLATLIRPDEGTLRVGGHDVVRSSRQVRSHIGLAGQHAAVEGALTSRKNLGLVGRLYGLGRVAARTRAREVIDQPSLDEVHGGEGCEGSSRRPRVRGCGGLRRSSPRREVVWTSWRVCSGTRLVTSCCVIP